MGERDEASSRPAESAEATPETIEVVHAKERVGSVLRGKWRLDSLLGVGGMASVYAATHRNGSRAAVKILHAGMSSSPFVRPRFSWEGYLANTVGHEGVVKVVEDDETEDGSGFLVTELLDGETLEQRRLRLGGRLPCDEVLLAADQVLCVLATAHAKGVIHRDIKPANLFLTRMGQIKVLDFGIARLRRLPASIDGTERGEMVAGTPAYMAPEQANGDALDDRSDVWACGATMFCLLSGDTVNDGATTREQLAKASSRRAPRLRSVAPGVDARVARLVDRALEFSKEGRWPNMLAMRRPLQEVYQDLYGHPIGDAPRLIFSADVPVDIATQEEPSSVPALSRRVPTPTQPSPAGRSPPRAHARGVAIGGAAAVGLLVGTLLVLAGWHAEGRAQATSSPQPMSDPAPMPAPSIAPQPSPEIVSEPPPSPPVIDPPIIAVSQASAPKRPALSASPSRVLNAQAPMAPAPIPQAPMVGAPMAPAPIPQAPLAEVPIPQSPTAVAPNTETPAANVPGAQVPRAETPSAQSECSPPYVVDVTTGKKRWKLECL